MKMNSSNSRVWSLDKYARFIAAASPVFPSSAEQRPLPQSNLGDWKHYDRKSGNDTDLKLCIKDPLNIMIYDGATVLESFSLHGAKEWLRLVAKGDSILFIYKVKEKARRFRIKFSETPVAPGNQNCAIFCHQVENYVPIKWLTPSGGDEMQIDTAQQVTAASHSQSLLSDSCIGGRSDEASSLKDLIAALMKKSPAQLGDFYRATNIPTENLADVVETCVLDQNFPDFVEQVEKILTDIQESD